MAIWYVKSVTKLNVMMSKTMTTKSTLKDFFSDEQLKKLGIKRNNNKKDKKYVHKQK